MKTIKINKYAAKAIALRDSGKTVEQVVAWYQRMTCSTAEVVGNVVVFWMQESVPAANGTYRFTRNSVKLLELPKW